MMAVVFEMERDSPPQRHSELQEQRTDPLTACIGGQCERRPWRQHLPPAVTATTAAGTTTTAATTATAVTAATAAAATTTTTTCTPTSRSPSSFLRRSRSGSGSERAVLPRAIPPGEKERHDFGRQEVCAPRG